MTQNLDEIKKEKSLKDIVIEQVVMALVGFEKKQVAAQKDFEVSLVKFAGEINKAFKTQEEDLTKQVMVLWGLVNNTMARNAAVERVLIKNGMSSEELDQEIKTVIEELQEQEGFVKENIDKILEDAPIPEDQSKETGI